MGGKRSPSRSTSRDRKRRRDDRCEASSTIVVPEALRRAVADASPSAACQGCVSAMPRSMLHPRAAMLDGLQPALPSPP